MPNNHLTVAEVTAFAEKIKAVLANAEQDRRTVIALRSLLGGGRAAAVLGKGGRKGRSNAEHVQTKVLEAIKGSKGGTRVGEIVDHTGINRAVVTRALQKLRQSGTIKLVGHKRLARYHAA